VLQVNQSPVLANANGQSIVLHAVPQTTQTIQLAQGGQGLQQLQVVPGLALQVSNILDGFRLLFIS